MLMFFFILEKVQIWFSARFQVWLENWGKRPCAVRIAKSQPVCWLWFHVCCFFKCLSTQFYSSNLLLDVNFYIPWSCFLQYTVHCIMTAWAWSTLPSWLSLSKQFTAKFESPTVLLSALETSCQYLFIHSTRHTPSLVMTDPPFKTLHLDDRLIRDLFPETWQYFISESQPLHVPL